MVSVLEMPRQTNSKNNARLQEQKRNFDSFHEQIIYLLSIAIPILTTKILSQQLKQRYPEGVKKRK